MEPFFDIHVWATLLLLIGLELVLGIDNILLISILTSRLPPSEQPQARKLGLGLAFLTRVLFVLAAGWITRLTTPALFHFTWKDLILLAGGLFLLFKAVKEIHHVVEKHDHHTDVQAIKATFWSVISQIILLDVVFSIDSVITAVGLTEHMWVIISSVLISFIIVLFFASSVSQFIEKNPALKVLALSFLVCIGVTLFVEGLQQEVPKGYIYLPMGFALVVELLQMRMNRNMEKSRKIKT